MNTFDWRREAAEALTTADQIRQHLDLKEEDAAVMEKILKQYPMRVTPYYLSLIDPEAGEADPIRRMCVPDIHETDLSGSFDTSGEASNTVLRGMQHKYDQTALILSTSRCAMYCRHCFRKRLVGDDAARETEGDIDAIADYVAAHPEITNVLISGGDAFLNENSVLNHYLKRFTAIETLDFIRFGTRVPVVLPQRIYEDEELLQMLEMYGRKKQLYVVTQFNHPRELTAESIRAVKALLRAGIIVRNQTVLLKGVNDDPEVLSSLLNGLTANGIVPYYVFQCRPVTGVKNQFQVPLLRGYDIVQQARNRQNGIGKSFRFIMSHPRGKIEILEKIGESSLLMKFHQAKYNEDAGRLFIHSVPEDAGWLPEELHPVFKNNQHIEPANNS